MQIKSSSIINNKMLIFYDSYVQTSNSSNIGQCDACSGSQSIFLKFNKNEYSIDNTYDFAPNIKIPVNEDYDIIHSPWYRIAPLLINKKLGEILNTLVLKYSFVDILDKYKNMKKEHILNIFINSVDLGVVLPKNGELPKAQYKRDILTSWLHLTNRCNLKCDYCYIGQNNSDMDAETGYTIIDSIFKAAINRDIRKIKLKFSGGEPLLNFQTIRKIHTYAKEKSIQSNIPCEYEMLSNGTLLNKRIIDELNNLGINLIISLDGLGHYHNVHRIDRNNFGTFKIISNNIKLCLKENLEPKISVTLSNRNIDGLPQLIEWLLNYNLKFSLNFYKKNDLSFRFYDLDLDKNRLIQNLLSVCNLIANKMPIHSFLNGLADLTDLSSSHIYSCGACQNYLVFDTYGNLSKCQMDLQHTYNLIGNNHDNPLAFLHTDNEGMYNLPIDKKEECFLCDLKYWCRGGCPLLTFRTNGNVYSKSPYCEVYKAILPEVLKLEGLRLYKYKHGKEMIN